ncbi:hypothetical protein R75461_08124 [Paraburkholderia nemoris]|uniref:FadR/GntR family transcriptional regulator n=1 Tax=Paraburkholderia nemoris TaxID=2793076 RepID=UPI00190D0416|nr:GntR family transcriptional regulator [Paraburkholderia nemoris]MBK3786758.1 FadR family transcriptional regulator [Paraburkholderia aspalathi]CAE6863625.1 hypothetical protein R75461_08124 [Paraburkholderia nemoris]
MKFSARQSAPRVNPWTKGARTHATIHQTYHQHEAIIDTDRRRGSQVNRVLDALVTAITENHYGGTLPPQDRLVERFGVCRTVIREAVAMLIARDMLDVRPKTGMKIRPASEWRIVNGDVIGWRLRTDDPQFRNDLIETCRHIVPPAAAQAAGRDQPAAMAAITKAFDALCVTGLLAHSIHCARDVLITRVLTASGNWLFLQMAPLVCRAFDAASPQDRYSRQDWEYHVRMHARVVDAIRQADPQEASAASLALIDAPFPDRQTLAGNR